MFGIDSISSLSWMPAITLWQALASVAHTELLYVLAMLGFLFTLMNFVWLKTTQLVQILRFSFNSGSLYVKVDFFGHYPSTRRVVTGLTYPLVIGSPGTKTPASAGNRVPTAW